MIDPSSYGFEEYYNEKVPQLVMWRNGDTILYTLPDYSSNLNEPKWVLDKEGAGPLTLNDDELIQYLRDEKVDQIVKKK